MTGRAAIRRPAIPGALATMGVALAICLALSLHIAPPVSAQSASVELGMTVEPETIYVGDPFIITLSATYPRDHFVIFPQVEPDWGEFEVTRQTSGPTTDNGDGTLTSSIHIEAVLFSTGETPTPELSVAIRKPDGEIVNRPVRPTYVAVASVLSEDDEELRDIKTQAELPVPPDLLSFLLDTNRMGLLAAASGIGLAALAIYLWRRRQSAILPGSGPPAEIALRELDRIASLPLRSDSDFKERYTLVADCLRSYLWNQFGVHAPELTTRQTLRNLESSDMSASELRRLSRILEECDLVKFARFLPDEDDAVRVLERSREFVRETGAVPDADQAPAAVGAETA